MDFITKFSKAKGKDTMLVVVDKLSKDAHFLALSHPFTAEDAALLFDSKIVKLHGFPTLIVSDQDWVFLSYVWSELFKHLGTKIQYNSVYHPQTDGQT